MLLRRPTLTLYVFLVSGCYGGQSGDPGVDRSPIGPNEGPGGPLVSECQRTVWLPDEVEPSTHSCEVSGDGSQLGQRAVEWTCDCGGTYRPSEAARCDDALLDACGVKYSAATYCEYPLATCFPKDEAGDAWLCRCGAASPNPGAEVNDVIAGNCLAATAAACGETCENRVGSCQTSPDAANFLTCGCLRPFSAGATPNTASSPTLVAREVSCEATLAQTCGGTCASETGTCTLDETGFGCTCSDETSAHIDAKDLSDLDIPDIDQCGEAVYQACGALEVGDACSSETEQWTATCEPRPYVYLPGEAAPSSHTFDCECTPAQSDAGTDLDGGPSDGNGSVVTDAPDCETAIKATCPGAMRRGSDANGPTLDYGHTCAKDDDCSGGACYVPGTTVNPICSKHCTSNDDCPTFADCVVGAGGYPAGYCFVRCEDDDECLELNPAITNPLHCTSAFDTNAPAMCVQASEP